MKQRLVRSSFATQFGKYFMTSVVISSILLYFKRIISEHPELYLDEIQLEVCLRMNVHLSISTIYKALVEKLGYSLQVCYKSAAQRNETQQLAYKTALCLT